MRRYTSSGRARAIVAAGLALSVTFVGTPAVAFAWEGSDYEVRFPEDGMDLDLDLGELTIAQKYSYEDGVAGFFRYIGDTSSAEMVEDLTGVEGDAAHQFYDNALDNIESTQSALNLDSVEKAIQMLEKCNELRRAAGLSELKVNTQLMALSAVAATYAANYYETSNHHKVAQDNNIGENLAWNNSSDGVENAFDKQWYIPEKEMFDEATQALYGKTLAPAQATEFYGEHKAEIVDWVEEHYGSGKSVGHYTNIVDPDYAVMGAACCDKLSGQNWNMYEQSFQYASYKGGKSYSLSAFKTKFNEYYDLVKPSQEKPDEEEGEQDPGESVAQPCQITLVQPEHGRITVDKTQVMTGEKVTVTITPDEGYLVTGLYLDGSGNSGVVWPYLEGTTHGEPKSHSCVITSDTTFTASLYKIGSDTQAHAITVTKPANGTLSSSHQTAEEGELVKVYATPDGKYETKSVTVRDANDNVVACENTASSGTWQFYMPDTDVTVSAEFEAMDWRIRIGQAEHGTVTAKGGDERVQGGTQTSVTVRPDEGYELAGISITDDAGNPVAYTVDGSRYVFTMPNMDVDVTASFVKSEEHAPAKTFPDVRESDWYYDTVMWAVENDVFGGYSDGTFGPADTLTRGQMAQVLYNMAGRPGADPSDAAEFSDCDTTAFYAEAVAWCADQGIFTGYDDSTFGPLDTMSREQFAVVLWRLEGEPAGTGDLSSFPDATSVSPFATDAIRWAVGEGIIQGTGAGEIAPQGAVDRASAATMIMRFVEATGYEL